MNEHRLVVHGDPSEFWHGGAPIILGMWLFGAIVFFITNILIPHNPEINEHMLQQGKFSLFTLGFISIFSMGIYLQTIRIDDKHIRYSSNYFPLIQRKIIIADISSIGFHKDFSRLYNPPVFSDAPVVGDLIYNNDGVVLGGLNTKVYNRASVELVKKALKDINPNIQV